MQEPSPEHKPQSPDEDAVFHNFQEYRPKSLNLSSRNSTPVALRSVTSSPHLRNKIVAAIQSGSTPSRRNGLSPPLSASRYMHSPSLSSSVLPSGSQLFSVRPRAASMSVPSTPTLIRKRSSMSVIGSPFERVRSLSGRLSGVSEQDLLVHADLRDSPDIEKSKNELELPQNVVELTKLIAEVRALAQTDKGKVRGSDQLVRRMDELLNSIQTTYFSKLVRLGAVGSVKQTISKLNGILLYAKATLERAVKTSNIFNRRKRAFKNPLANILADLTHNDLGMQLIHETSNQPEEHTEPVQITKGDYALMLGDKAFFGHGILQSFDIAFEHYQTSSELHHPAGLVALAYMYRHGLGCHVDLSQAITCYQHAAELGSIEAFYNLGHMYEFGEGMDKNEAIAHKMYTKAAGGGHVEAQTSLGLMYEHGVLECGIDQNEDLAAVWYKKAADTGYARAQNNLGYLLYKMGDYETAIEYFRLASIQGAIAAHNNLAICYETGNGAPKSLELATSLYKKASDRGNPFAQCNMGYIYLRNKQFFEALDMFHRASEKGILSAHYYIGQMYENGAGIEQSLIFALKHYMKAAEAGIGPAQYKVANSYFSGVGGCEKDYSQALFWYKKAANCNVAAAKNNLGIMYEKGLGVSKDINTAISWYQNAIEQNNCDAMHNLAVVYEKSQDVGADSEVVAELYARAAKSGSIQAKMKLAKAKNEQQK